MKSLLNGDSRSVDGTDTLRHNLTFLLRASTHLHQLLGKCWYLHGVSYHRHLPTVACRHGVPDKLWRNNCEADIEMSCLLWLATLDKHEAERLCLRNCVWKFGNTGADDRNYELVVHKVTKYVGIYCCYFLSDVFTTGNTTLFLFHLISFTIKSCKSGMSSNSQVFSHSKRSLLTRRIKNVPFREDMKDKCWHFRVC
jgi:hypothetical protein